MNDAVAFKQALTTAPGNTRVSITAESIAAFDAAFQKLKVKQAITSRNRRGSAAARNVEWAKAENKVRNWIITVQGAADKAPDTLTSIAIIKDCGLKPRKDRVYSKPDIEVRNDDRVPRLLHLISKAAHRRLKALYVWEVSINGKTFIPVKHSMKCKTTWRTNVARGSKLTFRKRIDTNSSDEPGIWSALFSLIVA